MSGTPYLVGSFSAAAGGSVTPQFTITNSVGSGDAILIGTLCTSGSVTAVSDSQQNGYTLIDQQTTNSGCQLYIWAAFGAIPLTGGTDIVQVTYSTNASVQGVIVVGDNGVNQTFYDVIVRAAGTSTTPSVATGTLGSSEEHIISFIADLAAGGVPTLGGGLTALTHVEGGTVAFITAGYEVVTSSASVTPSGTITSTTWAIQATCIKTAAVAVSTNLADGYQGEAYSQTLEATGGVGPYTWLITSGAVPPGTALASGVISGTLGTPGAYTLTVQATDVNGLTATSTQTVTIAAAGASGAPPQPLNNNLLSAADSDFEVAGFTWAASVNANAPARSQQTSLTGSWCLSWSSAADGDTTIATAQYGGVKPNSPYIVSAFLDPSNMRTCLLGVNWYTSGGTQIGSTVTIPNAISANPLAWQPVPGTVTSPATAAKFALVATVQATNKGEMQRLELPYIAQAGEQVLVDWVNSPFAPSSLAGLSFMDVSSFVRMDAGITTTRGRTDNVSEIQPGSANFTFQNDNGLFTRLNSPTLITAHGGTITLGRRCQINYSDELGNWHTRFDGPIADIAYDFENTGTTSAAKITTADVLAYLSRRDALKGWTRERIRADGPMLHWALNDTGTTGGSGIAAETSGNNGPAMRLLNSDNSKTATITWQTTTGGVETLADAVGTPLPGIPNEADGSEFWNAGSNQPNSPIRGLDSGRVGPFTTPVPAPYFVPKLTAQTGQNFYSGNLGYMLQAQFPGKPLNPGITGNDFAIECWFTMDPGIGTNDTHNYGPFVPLSFGSSRKLACYVAGVFYNAGSLQFGAFRYANAPAFENLNLAFSGIGGGGGPPATDGAQVAMATDIANLPHHLVFNLDADTPGAPVCHVYLDGVLISTFNMRADDVIDTLCVGGAYGGGGNFWGSVSLVSIYPFQLSGAQINHHCQLGEYGMWETTTDDSIAEIAAYSGLPPFWNSTTGAHNGLSLTEYQDITNQNPLTAMQLYEQAEKGLLYVNAAGQLAFHTRDWRMGYPGPDLLLPPNTFDAAMQYGIVDRFLQNEAGVATQVLQTGSGAVNASSQGNYGPYATNPPSTPQQLPLITWTRAAGQLGLPAFGYATDPNLDDLANWNANASSDPYMIPGLLTVDLLTLDSNTGLGISNFYALDIDNVIAPNGTVPASFPNQALSQEWFIEGIQETRSLTVKTLGFYCSPTTAQRAWRPGDATYGVLGTTSRVGIAQNDSPFLQADGKDVTHDAGRPYWPPNFQPGGGWSFVANGTPLANNYFIASVGQSQSVGIGDKFTVSPPDGNVYTVTAFGSPFAGFVNVSFAPNAPSVLNSSFTLTQLISMNNPAQNGHGYIGANDIRGLADNLNLMLKPPMCVVTGVQNSQSFASGSLAAPDVFWDTIHVDTASGMGLMPGWPNWYVCTVPGFYDIDVNMAWAPSGSVTGAAQGWIVVARAAAQAITAGTGNPRTVTNYVCPIGESVTLTDSALNSATNSPTTRLYLGLGDMVALAAEQNSGAAFGSSTGNGGSHMSILFRGYGQVDDSRQFNASINGGAVTDNLSTKIRRTKTYQCVASYSYNGFGARQNVNGFAFQGVYPGPTTIGPGGGFQGFQRSAYLLPFAQMQSDIGPTATIEGIQITMTNVDTWHATGATALIGYSTRSSLGSLWTPSSADHVDLFREAFSRRQRKTFGVPVSSFKALGTSAGFIILGYFGQSFDPKYYAHWNGGPGWLSVTITYLK